jgi:hypothetical protein
VPSRRLSTYLNDHYAAAVAAGELVHRSTQSNRGTGLGRALDRLATEIDQDRAALRTIMCELGIRPDLAKVTGAWLAEKAGRLKLNGSLLSYSPLSRLEELELLALGVEGKLRLWLALQRAEVVRGGHDLESLVKRARSQLRRLERYRLEAVEEAL